MAAITQGIFIGQKTLLQSIFAIDKAGRTKVRGNIVQSNVFKLESLVLIVSCIVHSALGFCGFWVGVSTCILRKIQGSSITATSRATEQQQG